MPDGHPLRARLADALEDSFINVPAGVSDETKWANYLADVLLALPDIAIVELPEPMPRGQTRWPDDFAFPVGEESIVRVFNKSVRWGDSEYSMTYARSLAAALLAAANVAERAT